MATGLRHQKTRDIARPTPAERLLVCDTCKTSHWTVDAYGKTRGVLVCSCNTRFRDATPKERTEALSVLRDSHQNILLRAISERPSYGLELMERVSKQTGGAFHQGNLYPLLREMERDGLLESWDGETTPERGGRPRRYYRITAAGARLLEGG